MNPTYTLSEILTFTREINDYSFWEELEVLVKQEKYWYSDIDKKLIDHEIEQKLKELKKI